MQIFMQTRLKPNNVNNEGILFLKAINTLLYTRKYVAIFHKHYETIKIVIEYYCIKMHLANLLGGVLIPYDRYNAMTRTILLNRCISITETIVKSNVLIRYEG